MNTPLLSGKELAQILNISKALAYRLIAQGEIPAVRFGRTVRVRKEDLETFINNKTVPSMSAPNGKHEIPSKNS